MWHVVGEIQEERLVLVPRDEIHRAFRVAFRQVALVGVGFYHPTALDQGQPRLARLPSDFAHVGARVVRVRRPEELVETIAERQELRLRTWLRLVEF